MTMDGDNVNWTCDHSAILNHHVVFQKLILCYVSCTSIEQRVWVRCQPGNRSRIFRLSIQARDYFQKFESIKVHQQMETKIVQTSVAQTL